MSAILAAKLSDAGPRSQHPSEWRRSFENRRSIWEHGSKLSLNAISPTPECEEVTISYGTSNNGEKIIQTFKIYANP